MTSMELPTPKYYKLVSKEGEDKSNGAYLLGIHYDLWQFPNGDRYVEVQPKDIKRKDGRLELYYLAS